MLNSYYKILKRLKKLTVALLTITSLHIFGVACSSKSGSLETSAATSTNVDITPVVDSLLDIENIDEARNTIAQQIDTTKPLADTILYSYYFNLGKVLHEKEKNDSALLCWNRAKNIAENIARHDLIIDANNRLVNTYSNLMQLEKSMEIGLQSIKLANSYHPEKLRPIYEEQARIYFLLNQASNEAMNCLKKALALSENEKDSASYARLCFKISTVFHASSELDSAEIYLRKAIGYLESVGADNLGNAYTTMGNIYSDRGKFRESIPYFLKSLKIRKERNKSIDFVFFNLGSVYQKMGKSDSAIYYLRKSLEYYGDQDYRKKLAYKQLAQNYNDIGNYKLALESYVSYMDLREKEYDKNLELSLNDLEEKYKSKEKEQKIEELNKEMAFERKVKSQQKVIIIVLIAFFVSVVLGTLFYFKQKISREKREQVLLEQRLLRSQMNPHFILNTFTAIQYFISNNQNTQANKYLVKFSRLLRLSLDNSISSFVAIQDEIEAIQHYLDLQIMRFDRSFNYNLKVYNNFEEDFVFIPPMLIQPFVENAIEHGFKGLDKGGEVDVTIHKKSAYIECLIEDNGTGKTDNHQNNRQQDKRSLSTQITRKRLKYLSRRLKTDASLEILGKGEGSDGSGLIVKLKIPFKTENHA